MMDWPTPKYDTGIGVHDCSDCHWKPADFAGTVKKLKERGISWWLLLACDEGKWDWAKYLVDNGIMVILRLWPTYAPKLQFDIAHLERYRDQGVKWFVIGNEPNLDCEWDIDMPAAKEAAYRVANNYAAKAGVVRSRGMWPLTPPMSLGGVINHRTFFMHFMDRISQLGNPMEILYPGGIGIHCRSIGNRLDAGPEDYDCSAREWEWFDSVVKKVCGQSLPLINTEAFDEPDWLPKVGADYDWELWKSRNIKQMRWFDPKVEGYKYPMRVAANCFWLLKSTGFLQAWDEDGLIDNHAHDRQKGGLETNLWKAMVGLVDWTREQPAPPPPDPLKVIVPLAEEKLGAIPVPSEWAFPSKAKEYDCEYQVGGYDQVEIDGKLWAFQTFTNAGQNKYGVAYAPEGEWDKTAWAWLRNG